MNRERDERRPTLIGLHIFPIDAQFEGAGCRKHGQILSTDTLLVDPALRLPTRSASAAFREEFYLEPTLRFPLQVQQQQHKNLCLPWSFVSSFFPEIVLLYSPCCGRGKTIPLRLHRRSWRRQPMPVEAVVIVMLMVIHDDAVYGLRRSFTSVYGCCALR